MAAQAAISDTSMEIVVSAATFQEVGTHIRQRRITLEMPEFTAAVRSDGFHIHLVNEHVAGQAGILNWSCVNPWDRVIAATANDLGIPVISSNPEFDDVVAKRIW